MQQNLMQKSNKRCYIQENVVFTRKVDKGSLKSDVDKLDIDRLATARTNLSQKSKVDKLDMDKLKAFSIDLKKLGGVVDNLVVQKIPQYPILMLQKLSFVTELCF